MTMNDRVALALCAAMVSIVSFPSEPQPPAGTRDGEV